MSAPWLGVPKAIRGSVTGDDFDMSGFPLYINDVSGKRISQNWGTVPLLMPRTHIIGEDISSTVVVQFISNNKTKNYTVNEVDDFLSITNSTIPLNVRKNYNWNMNPNAIKSLKQIYCFAGINHPTGTEVSLIYESINEITQLKHMICEYPDDSFNSTWNSGDGTVPFTSLLACKDFGKYTTTIWKSYEGANTEHREILVNSQLIQDILKISTKKFQRSSEVAVPIRSVKTINSPLGSTRGNRAIIN